MKLATWSSPGLRLSPKYHHATCHIFAHKVLSGAPDDQYGPPVFIFFHVDAGPVAHVIADEDAAVPGRQATDITGMTVDNDLASVHGVATAVLSIAVDY